MVLRRNDSRGEIYPSPYAAREVLHRNNSLQLQITSFLKRRFAAQSLLAFFREYSATLVVAVCVIVVALINFSSAKGNQGSLFGTFGTSPENDSSLKNKIAIQNESKNNLAVAPLAEPMYFVSQVVPEEQYEDTTFLYSAPTIQSQVTLATYSPSVPGGNGREAKTYIVKEGDTAGSIAARHGISASTILWANNLSDTSIL